MTRDQFTQEVIKEAKRWVDMGVPYEHRGTTVKGCDCIGFMVGVMQSLGFMLDFKMPYYPTDWCIHKDTERLTDGLLDYCFEIDTKQFEPADLLIFKFGRTLSHSGIYLGNNLFAHSLIAKKRCCYATFANSTYEKRLKKVYRVKNEVFA